MRKEAAAFSLLAVAFLGFVFAEGGAASNAQQPANVAGSTPNAVVQVASADSANASVYFVDHVMPLLSKLGCNQTKCHGSRKGQSGFKLSIFGADPEDDFAALTKLAEGRRINKVEPSKSLFLLKATASIAHEGSAKAKVPVDSAEYNQLVSWIAAGGTLGRSETA